MPRRLSVAQAGKTSTEDPAAAPVRSSRAGAAYIVPILSATQTGPFWAEGVYNEQPAARRITGAGTTGDGRPAGAPLAPPADPKGAGAIDMGNSLSFS